MTNSYIASLQCSYVYCAACAVAVWVCNDVKSTVHSDKQVSEVTKVQIASSYLIGDNRIVTVDLTISTDYELA